VHRIDSNGHYSADNIEFLCCSCHARKHDTTPRPTTETTNCIICGLPFTYTRTGRKRKYCDNKFCLRIKKSPRLKKKYLDKE
jgi:hypothetical protein